MEWTCSYCLEGLFPRLRNLILELVLEVILQNRRSTLRVPDKDFGSG